MADFKVGDRVSSGGAEATVISVEQLIRVDWGDGILGYWPAASFQLVQPRKFKEGDYVRSVADDDTNGTVGIIFEDDGDDEDSDPYLVGLFNARAEELPFSAHELVPWVPLIGERVLERDEEDDEEGVVIAFSSDADGSNFRVRVLWDSFPLAQDWPLADLEPVDEYEEDEDEDGFEVGDSVIYSSPVFAGTFPATVVTADDNVIWVRFDNSDLNDGAYSKDFFSKAA